MKRAKFTPYSFQSSLDNFAAGILILPQACFLGGDRRFPDQAAHEGEGVCVLFDGVLRYTLQCLILYLKKKKGQKEKEKRK